MGKAIVVGGGGSRSASRRRWSVERWNRRRHRHPPPGFRLPVAGTPASLVPGVSRRRRLFAFLLLHAVVSLGPFVLLHWPAMLTVVAVRLAYAWRFRQPLWSALLYPFAAAVLLAAAAASFIHAHSRPGVAWRGRSYRIG